eukprot:328548-Rhodomonas_salina.1
MRTHSGLLQDCSCRAGYYALNATTCAYCPEDHYCQGENHIAACHNHSLTPMGSNHSGACTCDRGYYESGPDNCTLCPANSWCWGGVRNDCPAGLVSEPGLSWPENCTAIICKTYDFHPDMFKNGAHYEPITDCPGCLSDNAIVLDASLQQYLDLGTTNVGGSFTVTSWLYLQSNFQYQRFFGFGNILGVGDNLDLSFQNGNIPFFHARTGATIVHSQQFGPSTSSPFETWFHMTLSYDDTTRISRLYKNGVLIQTSAQQASQLPTISRIYSFLGRDIYTASSPGNIYTSMKFTDFRWYNTVLFQEQITNVYLGTRTYSTLVHPLSGMECTFLCPQQKAGYWCDGTLVPCSPSCSSGTFETQTCEHIHDRLCQECPANSWCAAGVANVCPQNSQSPALSDSQQDCLCDPGYYGPAGGLCQECTVDHWCPGGGPIHQCPPNATSLHVSSDE